MNLLRQAFLCAALGVAGTLTASATGSNTPVPLLSAATNLPVMPTPPEGRKSPVEFFRKLLAMSPAERADFLTNKPPEFRERILAKVREYQVLDPDERELRLRATDVRWYLIPFLHEPATNRAERLAKVPEELRDLVKTRVEEWDALPPEFQQEFIANERTLHYFSHVDSTNRPPPPPGNSTFSNVWQADQARWNALSEASRRQLTNQFNQFFELTPDEKQKALRTLSAAERALMEQTLAAFDKLPPPQRAQCIRAYTQFASMSPAERAQFLKNAEQWSQMSPKERQAWRDLVSRVPQWPPLPTAAIMPPKPVKPKPATNLAVTNG